MLILYTAATHHNNLMSLISCKKGTQGYGQNNFFSILNIILIITWHEISVMASHHELTTEHSCQIYHAVATLVGTRLWQGPILID